MKNYNYRDISVEILRIIGCIIVIGVHVCLNSFVNGVYDESRLYIACLLADGVAVFWLIMGFFLFNNTDYIALLKHSVKSVILPMIVFSLFMFYFRDFLVLGVPIEESIYHPLSDYKNILVSILRWQNPISGCGHLWYLYVYMIIIFLFPVIKPFVAYISQNNNRVKGFLIVSLYLFVINDITNNRLMAFSHHSINAAFPAAIEVIWGGILYNNKNKLIKKARNKTIIFTVFALFLILNVLRLFIELYRNEIGESNYILYWYSSIGIICAVFLSIIAFLIGEYINNIYIIKNIVLSIGKSTFFIYLIHTLVRDVLNRFGLESKLSILSIYFGNGVIFELIYTFLKIGLIFIVSLFIALLLNYIKRLKI